MKKSIITLMSCVFSSVVFADNPLSIHVLNLESGTPSANLKVILEAQQGDKWVKLNEGSTNEQGRINELYPKDSSLKKGVYKVTFETGNWYKTKNQRTFYPEVPVIFVIDGQLEQYHIPLLISPYGYSTYRGQ